MLATETRVQVSILGYLFSDLKEAVGGRQDSGVRSQESGVRRLFLFIVPTPHTPHPTPHFPEKAYSAIQANKNETFALRISPDW
ncbi:MAG: hypothetical protein EWV58_15250 [Microcystis aeruginosa Ma_MB_F_20061100_S19]|uniref:Uncharacterized protein n=2 Tax=Microcystis aeruginosa TaxID=1126 RepID=S3JGE5_MICAE|nr:hypothetical protein MAESPC_01257 [Microcystis aeruginosa SPC777]NCR98019.1 hypothetical protein [Microcystis aeruginosa L311-01]TRU05937.1 MAG: hypothetical protein EWV59_21005 [Microcystis aeruginosa Ma_MB_F_20061100_S19D]TRU13108.1 MAG: hypothetical protein EWV58_15250 [Microcystis aeruginosa Ma_MB_F_20061100_S19]